MKVQVYNGEKHDRSPLWYIVFWTVFVWIIVLSLLFQNWSGVIVMFFFLGWYLFYQVTHLQLIQLEVDDNFLRLGDVTFSWSDFVWFALEIDKKTERVKNIVFVWLKEHRIYSFADENDAMRDFVMALQEKLPLTDQFPQSLSEKFMRKIKL